MGLHRDLIPNPGPATQEAQPSDNGPGLLPGNI